MKVALYYTGLGGFLWTGRWTLRLYRTWGVYWPAERLLACPEGVSSTELEIEFVEERGHWVSCPVRDLGFGMKPPPCRVLSSWRDFLRLWLRWNIKESSSVQRMIVELFFPGWWDSRFTRDDCIRAGSESGLQFPAELNKGSVLF